MITLFYHFRYTISDPNWLKVESPVYMSSRGKTFTDWLCNWTALLASKVNSLRCNYFICHFAAISFADVLEYNMVHKYNKPIVINV